MDVNKLKKDKNTKQYKNCNICDAKFTVSYKYRSYCSDECCKEGARRVHDRANNKYNIKKSECAKNISKELEIICTSCSKKFTKDIGRTNFCSEKCSNDYFIYTKSKEYYKRNRIKENFKLARKLYKDKNKEFYKNYNIKYRENNKEKLKENKKIYYLNNKEYINKQCLLNSKVYRRDRRKSDPEYRLREQIRGSVRRLLKKYKKGHNTKDFIDYTSNELKLHLESLWIEGMSWENYGFYGWHIDHIKPISSFKLIDNDGNINIAEIKKCLSMENLQPLWMIDNIKKSNKIENLEVEDVYRS